MHFDLPSAPPNGVVSETGPWYKDLTRYHWFVLVVASLGWLFDTMDQQLFNLARRPAITELLKSGAGGVAPLPEDVTWYSGVATMIFMIGWASGGLVFGVLGDKIGRAKTMMLTIVLYSMFTGLSALSIGIWDFSFYRFLTGLGVGGEFAVGVALVAEVMPNRARPYALGLLQALSAFGNMMAAVIAMILGELERSESINSAWRIMFVIGMAPALLAIVIRRRLKEPERWKAAVADGPGGQVAGATAKAGSISDLFGTPERRRNTIVGMLMGFSGVVGLWGIGFFSFDVLRPIMTKSFATQGITGGPELAGKLTFWTGIISLLQNFGGFWGVLAFTRVTGIIGRRPSFLIGYILAMVSTAFTFWYINEFWHIFVMIPIMGFCQMTLFGGFSIYFPELFPTRLRSTGTSFCYNVGRYLAAFGPLTLGYLTKQVFGGYGEILSLRYACLTMCSVFLIGIFALPFAPETKGKPLPE